MNQKMEMEAVDLAYTFGMEDRFNSQKLVTTYLRESKEPLKKMKGKPQGSLAAVVIIEFYPNTDSSPALISLLISSSLLCNFFLYSMKQKRSTWLLLDLSSNAQDAITLIFQNFFPGGKSMSK